MSVVLVSLPTVVASLCLILVTQLRRQSFDLLGDSRGSVDPEAAGTRWSSYNSNRRRHSHSVDEESTSMVRRSSGSSRRFQRRPSETASSPPGIASVQSVHTSRTWTGQHHQRRLYGSVNHNDVNDNDDDDDSESDGEGWC